MSPDELTAVILTRDEAPRLRAAIESLPPGLPVLVVDALSTDGTAALARSLGARVIERAWNGFLDARRFGLAAAGTPWVLWLDADERLDPALARAIARERPVEGVAAYAVRRVTRMCRRRTRACGWDREVIVRIVRADAVDLVAAPAAGGRAPLHERWVARDGTTKRLRGAIVHDSYPTLRSYFTKYGRYTSIEAEYLESSVVRLGAALVAALVRFPLSLLRHNATADGWRGWFVAFFSAMYPVVVHWKALRAKR